MHAHHARRRRPPHLAIAALLLVATVQASAESSTDGVWSDAPPPTAGTRRAPAALDTPSRYREATLNLGAMSRIASTRSRTTTPSLDLPLPDGGYSRFELTDAGVMPPALAARFPELASYTGRDAEGRRVRLDMAPDGIHAAVHDTTGDWRVRPATTSGGKARGTTSTHLVYRRADAAAGARFEEGPLAGSAPRATRTVKTTLARRGAAELRDFRIAVTATSAYTARVGGSVADGMAGIVRTINRVNDVFENDLGIHLVLTQDNDRLVFTDPATDPFATIASDEQVALENTRVTDALLGQSAFDVGHVLDGRRASGIVGALGNTCLPWSATTTDPGATKAAGMTGSSRPIGDDFHIDFVTHELGHQFGAHHTFNGCDAGARSPYPFAPGSGSTVMGYAGLCRAYDLQPHSDPYFHAASIEQVGQWVSGVGGACASTRPNPARVPTIDREPTGNVSTVPARTPFRLKGAASFADPQARLTYTFEQMNAGRYQASPTLVDVGDGPLFRSRLPTARNEQSFPSMAVLLGDESFDLGDTLPTGTRDLRFTLTVRDSLDRLSHVVSEDRLVRVVDTGQAFSVVAPAAGAKVRRGKPRALRWNVAGTATAPIACAAVRVDLSVDGGRSFLDEPLLASVPNTGRASFTVPDTLDPTRRARLRVGCADESFFALSPGEFDLR